VKFGERIEKGFLALNYKTLLLPDFPLFLVVLHMEYLSTSRLKTFSKDYLDEFFL
jgi:hypothetical protein